MYIYIYTYPALPLLLALSLSLSHTLAVYLSRCVTDLERALADGDREIAFLRSHQHLSRIGERAAKH